MALALGEEVDLAQARIFARRAASVDDSLGRARAPIARLFRVGLRVRLIGMLAAPGPRALRVRALADFYYSQLGRELHRREARGAPSLDSLVSSLQWRERAPGLEHASLDGPSAEGPMHLNLLRVDPGLVRAEAYDCRPGLARGLDFAAFVTEQGAAAAVSGGFFLYSEPDIEAPSQRYDPVGLLMSAGRLLNPPMFRRGSLLVGTSAQSPGARSVEIAALGPEALTVRMDGRALPCASVVTRAQARRGPARESIAVVGTRVLARGHSLAVPLNGFVLPIAPDTPVEVGDALDYAAITTPGGRTLHAGIAGGPMLVEAGTLAIDMRGEDFWGSAPPVTFSQDETGDHNQLPRLAAGTDAEGRLLLAAVDGRNFERALGMTLAELGRLMIALGCERATNLDGGSSKRMVLDGRSVDLASTEILAGGGGKVSVRPVHTGLLLFCER